MGKRLGTLIIGLALGAAACGADVDPGLDAGSETALSTSTSTTLEEDEPVVSSPTPQATDDYGFDPDQDGGDPSDDTGGDTGGRTPTDDNDNDNDNDASGGIEPVPVDDESVPVAGEAPRPLMDAIMADLEGHTGGGAQAPTVLRSESVVWSDGSLGCPEPGVFYTQATVAGYWIVIEYGGSEYDYRANDKGFFLRCESGLGQPPGGNPTQ